MAAPDAHDTPVKTSNIQLIGNTPLLEFTHFESDLDLKAKVYGKVEAFNLTGSIKDRAALYMIEAAEREGKLKPGSTIIEPTSGNTGIALSAIGSAKGYKVILVMPDTMSVERRRLMKAYGAEIVLTDGAKGISGSIEKAGELLAEIESSFMPDQFSNAANAQAHYETTGPEIWRDTDGDVDVLVSGVGTGGTITGAGRYLKEQDSHVKVIAVEPNSSAVLSGDKPGPHKIQGIGTGFIPGVLDTAVYDEIIRITNEDAFATGAAVARKEGILAGISSGAAVSAALQIAQREENAGKNIVVILPDSGDRYLSTPLFAAE
ncbi:cysteine synthase A [Scardovia wiggsiae F0424]|uniref:cysteine synthase n=1 Tax=Scardovia wiggsiae F0424 TaxID=857290 RepID=J0LMH6_9BIFI|nr:cysteine synthase A [Scardovia wiggsiae]EJD65007.1 cysteine synthase A [Scardovia wiggsiae F0424]